MPQDHIVTRYAYQWINAANPEKKPLTKNPKSMTNSETRGNLPITRFIVD